MKKYFRLFAICLCIVAALAVIAGPVRAGGLTQAAPTATITGGQPPTPSPTATPAPTLGAGDTTGIVIWAIVLVVIVIVGIIWGQQAQGRV